MSTAKEIKELIDKMNKGEVNIDEDINKMGDFFVKKIREEYEKHEKSDPNPDYWEIAKEALQSMLEEMEGIEESEE